jgi:predicted DNA-binding transcriptional regulator AlpA
MPPLETLLDEAEVSKVIGRSVPTLQKDRVQGSGPPYIKFGRQVRYRPSDVQAWLDERIRQSTSDQGDIRGSAGEAAAPTRRLSLGKFHDPSAREIFQALGGKPVPGGYLVHCPVPSHGSGRGDQNPSLSVADGRDGKLLVHCHAGCNPVDVLAALRARGLIGGRP